jgi:hypothetical protein
MASSYPNQSWQDILNTFLCADGLPFDNVLSEDFLNDLAQQHHLDFAAAADDIYTPPITLWLWLCQCLSAAKSCVAAVARLLVLRVACGLPPCSAATGAYCKARAKLSESFLRAVTLHVGTESERPVPPHWRWRDRRVLLADGTECSAPDTPALQAVYPHSSSQKPGLSFPRIRLVVLLAFASACLLGCAIGPYQGKQKGELSLFRELLAHLLPGDVLVADRYYCAYWLIAQIQQRGADMTTRLHSRRSADFRRGHRLGRGDHIVTWPRPHRSVCGVGVTDQEYAALPAALTIREVRVRVTQPGYRTQEFVVVTTLLDAQQYTAADIAQLYHQRWRVELDIRGIKQTLKMDVLSCKTPELVRKEIWTHLLGYNLVRRVMLQAALQNQTTPRRLSLAGAVQTLCAFRWLLVCGTTLSPAQLGRIVGTALGVHKVGERPGRFEPRTRKRRPKFYPLLMRTRAEERARLMGGGAG